MRDEGEYAYASQLLLHGVAPYEHSFIQKPPMVIYSYALAQLILPQAFWGPRLLAYLFVALATVLLGYIARKELGERVAWPAMLLVTPMLLLPDLDQFPANTEMFLLLPLLGLFAVYVRARQTGQKPVHWFAAGCLGATTLCYKYTALPPVAFLFLVWLAELWRQDGVPAAGKFFAVFLAGGLAATGLELGYFLCHDGGRTLWECTVRFNHYYVASSNFNQAYAWSWLATFWKSWWILFLLPWAVLLRPNRRLWVWAGVLASALFATSASGYGQYYLLAMPFWALLAAAGICALGERFFERPTASGGWPVNLITVSVLILVLLPDRPWLVCSPETFVKEKTAGFPFSGSPIAGRRVAELSAPDEFVFVAGSEPQILFYAQRFSHTRFVTSYALMIPTAVAAGYQREAMEDLVRHPPKLIVFPTVANSWLNQADTPPEFASFLHAFLDRDYDLIGGYLPGEKNGVWAEPLATNQIAAANLLLFRRKNVP